MSPVINYDDFLIRVNEVRRDTQVFIKELFITHKEWDYLKVDYRTYKNANHDTTLELEPDCKAIVNEVKIFTCDDDVIKQKNKFIKAFTNIF